ncbi:prolyl oligopeptidase family serine peptidase [Mucilaginibacter terrae]|uniref:Dipeptidyl aminopeptidase/acylaminoacyl peptidase n=1 Tax=Mucilaginibacter terrae TaxID=1955052 RepID=A0ABU3GV82_9SPHI|nr:DPP IV N-terminal domain-containing protein [Mucilaginibacter terrae]MDT3403683.1 dipeptidyl aminopeptidase/acylaminoacyl peptidase [Mucilaginibacter terrae]
MHPQLKFTHKLYLTASLAFGLLTGTASAQQRAGAQYFPSRDEMLKNYAHATLTDSAVKNTVFKTTVIPAWKPDGKGFIYRNIVSKDSSAQYVYVDAEKGTRQTAFDADKLTAALSTASGTTVSKDRLVLYDLKWLTDGSTLEFRYKNRFYNVNLNIYAATLVATKPTQPYRWRGRRDSISPDKKWVAFIKDYNVHIRPVNGGEAVKLSTIGTKEKPFGELRWAPNGHYLIGFHTDPRELKKVYHILTSLPNTTRGELRSQPYAQPGDEFTSYEMYTFDVASHKEQKVKEEKIDFLGVPDLSWEKDGRHFIYEKADRGHQRYRIIEVDAQTGTARTLIEEKTKTFIYEQRIYMKHLPATDEIVWSSEKDGWRHLYLVDTKVGKIKNAITSGNWVVRSIDSIDAVKREVWFTASGMNKGEDPYFIHYYRIGFNGKNLISLTPAAANHQATFSNDKKYFTDTYSTINTAPVTALYRTIDGKKVMDLEQADISKLMATGIKLPEVFVAKARDGVTDCWGILCRPSNFDAQKSYPIIEYIYAGPHDSFVPKSFRAWSEMQSIAELGFMVVMLDGMGTANRSKAYHDVCWKNLADSGFPDRILWMKALANKYSYLDTTRVGIFGTSAGGQSSTGALLSHPEFYDCAVSACGCHDNRVDKQWWNEQWMGYPVGPHYAEQSNVTNAHKLKGNLLLIVGEADMNVPPESTYRVVDALIKANKEFDLLTVPGMGHSDGGPYGRRKLRDFFVKHLMGVDPPNRNL